MSREDGRTRWQSGGGPPQSKALRAVEGLPLPSVCSAASVRNLLTNPPDLHLCLNSRSQVPAQESSRLAHLR